MKIEITRENAIAGAIVAGVLVTGFGMVKGVQAIARKNRKKKMVDFKANLNSTIAMVEQSELEDKAKHVCDLKLYAAGFREDDIINAKLNEYLTELLRPGSIITSEVITKINFFMNSAD